MASIQTLVLHIWAFLFQTFLGEGGGLPIMAEEVAEVIGFRYYGIPFHAFSSF